MRYISNWMEINVPCESYIHKYTLKLFILHCFNSKHI